MNAGPIVDAAALGALFFLFGRWLRRDPQDYAGRWWTKANWFCAPLLGILDGFRSGWIAAAALAVFFWALATGAMYLGFNRGAGRSEQRRSSV
jgi:hypothetical protein